VRASVRGIIGAGEPFATVIERRLDIVRAGYDDAGCHNRAQALRWMSEGLGRGLTVTPIETRQLADGRVLILLQRSAPTEGESAPPPHGQILSFRDDKITEIVFYPTEAAALDAAGLA